MSESAKGSKSREGAALARSRQLPFTGIQFISSVRKTLKFEQALRKYTSCDILRFIENTIAHDMDASQDILSSSSLHYDHAEESSSELDTVLSLVVNKPFWTNGSGDSSSCDGEVCALLNTLLYPSSFRQNSFSESVWNGSVTRACVSAVVCEAILVDSVSDRNCFSLLAVALESGSEILSHTCFKVCLSRFLDAVDNDLDGFVNLSLETFLFLIQHDGLNLQGNEEDALAAICIWVEHDLVNRLGNFVQLFATGIRFSEIDYYSLAELVDACDLVSYHHAATELAAHELIQKTMGLSTPNALGLGTIVGPRKPLGIESGRAHRKIGATTGVYHTRSLLHRLMHVHLGSDVESAIAHGALMELLKFVVAEADKEEISNANDTTYDGGFDHPGQPEEEKENRTPYGCKGGQEHHNDDFGQNMFSRASSVDFMMTSPSHRSFGSAANLPNLMAVTSGMAIRSILDLTDVHEEDNV